MSYTYLQEQGEESLVASFSDIPASVPSRLNLTAGKSSCNGNGTASYRSSQSGMMSKPLTASLGEERLMSCAGDFHARTSVAPGGAQELKVNDLDCGQTLPESLAKFDPASCSWKTHQCSLPGGLEPFLGTWPSWGMIINGELLARVPLEPIIKETDCGFLGPTPTVVMPLESYDPSKQNRIRLLKSGRPRKLSKNGLDGSLNWSQFQLWRGVMPTPMLCECVMGWPTGWTDLKPLETGKFQQWLNLHGKSYQEDKK